MIMTMIIKMVIIIMTEMIMVTAIDIMTMIMKMVMIITTEMIMVITVDMMIMIETRTEKGETNKR